ncbi:MAG: hypothetical protein COW79_01855 [Bdellovibrionales bacterium CG22_combo_CG10-13_8_21_14_all_38_13]|nr:MAG: hypothetical protein COW79_01855 [Bdellovibrionales bacterium CG22_combo_CG10-13_8_21_14_all_38_13]
MSKFNPLRAEYMAHIKKQKLSGMSIKKYCAANNLVEHKLSYYRSYPLKTKEPITKAAFASVKIKPLTMDKSQDKIDPVWLAEFLNKLLVIK